VQIVIYLSKENIWSSKEHLIAVLVLKSFKRDKSKQKLLLMLRNVLAVGEACSEASKRQWERIGIHCVLFVQLVVHPCLENIRNTMANPIVMSIMVNLHNTFVLVVKRQLERVTLLMRNLNNFTSLVSFVGSVGVNLKMESSFPKEMAITAVLLAHLQLNS